MTAKKIWSVCCEDMPDDVVKYVEDEMGHSTHCTHSLADVADDGNVFAEWLKTQGVDFEKDGGGGLKWTWVALFAT